MLQFAIAIFLGAFLLFLVQPLIGKFILPWFGGGSGVWTVCLLFFQVLLLGGYAYAHALSKVLRVRQQAIVHVLLLLTCLASLPIIPDAGWKPQGGGDPTWGILLLLTASIGVPYLALSATAPLLQAWFSHARPGVSPYRLYALSNAGSLLALLSYPLLMEPLASRVTQAMIWTLGFLAFAAGCGWCALTVWRSSLRVASSPAVAPPAKDAAPWFHRAMWVLLPASSSVLLMSFTARLSEEIAPIPLLWILPLAVYLLSFIISFEWPRAYNRSVFTPLLIASYGIVLLLMVLQTKASIGWQMLGSLTALFACCMVCHSEAYRLRPQPRQLTSFYLAIALGGALGGGFVTLIAPRIFTFYAEFYLALFAAFVLLMACLWRDQTSLFFRGAHRPVWLTLVALVLAAAYGMQVKHFDSYETALFRARNFYGILSLRQLDDTTDHEPVYALYHGRIIHGIQIMSQQSMHWPTTYFNANSGVGRVLQPTVDPGPRRIGVVGLGVGTLAAYGRDGDVMRFYEINPTVVELASYPFTYLSSSHAKVEVELGDARLTMEREEPQGFDVLVLDAFSGDSVPVHLLTIEAFEIYSRHLKDDGIILVHVSNQHLELHLVLMRLAAELKWSGRLVISDDDDSAYGYGASWVLLTQNQRLFDDPRIKDIAHRPRENIMHIDLWTDDRASLLQIIR